MAKGYPDFFGYSTFPQFGRMLYTLINANCPSGGVTTDVISIVGKGRTYTGYFSIDLGDNTGVGFNVRVEIDGQTYRMNNIRTDFTANIASVPDALLRLVYYDERGGSCFYTIAKDWTFSQSFIIQVTNGGGAAAAVFGAFHYASIQ